MAGGVIAGEEIRTLDEQPVTPSALRFESGWCSILSRPQALGWGGGGIDLAWREETVQWKKFSHC